MKFNWIMMGVMAVALAACSGGKQQKTKGPIVRLEKAMAVDQGESVVYPGRTKAEDDAKLAFRVSGTLEKVLVKEGDYVKKGQLVAVMDPRDYRTQLDATEAEYKETKANCERVIALYKDNATTPSNYDKAVAGLKQITAKYENHKNQLADTKLYSPFNGYVQGCLHESHETVGAGMPIIHLFSSNSVEVVINIPSSEYQIRDRFTAFSCTFEALPGQVYPLSLINIDQKANANQLYTVRLRMEGNPKEVTPGMTTMVTIKARPAGPSRILIPTTALLNQGQGSKVFVYNEKTQTISLKSVKVAALTSDGRAEISQGLQDGEQVVTAGVHSLKDGEKVRLFTPASETNVGGLL